MKTGWKWVETILSGFLSQLGVIVAVALATFLGTYLGERKATKTLEEAINRKADTTWVENRMFLKSDVKNVESAKAHELAGFKALAEKDIDGAISSFTMSENSYNSYHASYDIANYLRKRKDHASEPGFWKTTYQYVIANFRSFIPEEYLAVMKE